MITIYSTPTCVFCHMAREYFKSKGVDFTSIDVTLDQKALQAMVNKSGQMGVPVIDIGGDIIVGFDRPRIDLALRDKKLVA